MRNTTTNLRLLSELLFNPGFFSNAGGDPDSKSSPQHRSAIPGCDGQGTEADGDLEELRKLASTNHVIVRAFEPLHLLLTKAGKTAEAEWVANALAAERSRIEHATSFLARICEAFEAAGSPVTVIKSLDHWPDLGSDLDLYTDAKPYKVVKLMRSQFNAKLDARSWGDRLANKWNFIVPGLPELVEVHVGRLGQTGEQTVLTRSLSARTRIVSIGQHEFRVAAPEDRIIISTLQRMYRHFYILLCDVVDNAFLVDSRTVDFGYLHSLGYAGGIWEGISTYLTIVSDYVESYRGWGISLPALVTGSAKFGTDRVFFRRDFLRVPILPHSLNLYARELTTLLLRGDLRNTLRLSLLPGLATAAALEQKFTGSDKGIW